MMWQAKSLRWKGLSIAVAFLATGAQAQQPDAARADSLALEEITVTAQRRAESVQSVPIAISAFSEIELEQRNITETLDLVQYIPNLIGHNNTGLGSANAYYLRGLGTTESLATQDPPVGTYFDEIYISRQSANNLSLFDVERIEVLRGPQGTLFGRNTTGGAINVITKKPARESGGFLELGFGSFDDRNARGSVDLPIGERVFAKLSGFWHDDEGYVKNITTGERVNDKNGFGGRFALTALLSDSVTWDLSATYSENFSANLVNFDCNPANPADCGGRFVSTGLRRNNGGANQLAPLNVANGKGALPLGAETRFTLLASNLEFETGAVTLNAITGYIRTEQDYIIDFFDGRAAPTINFGVDPMTGLPTRYNVTGNINVTPAVRGLTTGGFTIANIAESEQFTQELKLTGSLLNDRVDYVAGVFYYNEKNDTDFADIFVTTVPLLLADRIVENDTTAYAGFFQADYTFSSLWKATAGVRYTDEKKDFDFTDNRPQCQVLPLPASCLSSANFASVDVDLNPATPNVAIPLTQTTKIWTPRFVLNYTPSDEMLFFASATRGFKSGSQSARATAVRSLLPFGPEKVWSYELGAKTEWLGRRLRVNATAFVQETDDFQAGSAFVNPANGALTFVTRNLGGLENTGLELEILARPIEPLTVTVAVGLQDIKYVIDRNEPAIDSFNILSVAAQQAECQASLVGLPSPRGDTNTAVVRAQRACTSLVSSNGELADPVRAPNLTVSAGLAYEIPLAAWDATLTPSLNVLFTDDQEVGTNNLSAFRSSSGVLNFAADGEFILGSFSEAHTVVNFNLALRTRDDRWFAALSCDNCFSETYPQATLSNFSYINPPATWAVKVRRKF